MNVHELADRIGRTSPLAYRLLRGPWVRLMRALGRPGYWESRRHYRYYEEVVRMAREHAGEARCAIDVGGSEAQVLERLGWLERRVALDVRYTLPRPGIETITADFLDYEADGPFDLVLCLQVLEHVPDPGRFARKLIALGGCVIVSVPYRWPAGVSPNHSHDPIDETRLSSWMGTEPTASAIVDDGRPRLVAVYEGAATGGSD